jgi:hypothetical protein
VTAQGSNLDTILLDAVKQLDAFYGDREWSLRELRARPLVTTIDKHTLDLWEAEVEAGATANALQGRQPLDGAVLISLVGGFVVGLTSVGTGVFFGLTLLVLFPLRAHKVVGTDIFHAAALLYVAGLGHFIAGNVDIGAVGWLLIGSIPGILIGSQLSLSVPDRLLRGALATVLGLSGLRLLNVPGTTTAIVIVLACGMTALLTYIARHSWLQRQAKAATRASLR